MVIAIILGIIIGVVGFLPLIFGWNKARMATATSNLGQAGGLLLGVFLSLMIVLGAMIICIVVARDIVLYFVFAMAGALIVSAIVFGIWKNRK